MLIGSGLSFARLGSGAVVEISDGPLDLRSGRLIERVLPRRGVRADTVLEINPKLARVLRPAPSWTQIDWEQRQLLRNKPLALWLHGFYASHATPHALTVEYLHKLSGSRDKSSFCYFKTKSGPGATGSRSRRRDPGL